ncbi:integrin alpha [Microlunatus capsulatus]|uniref:FG-GAP repeat-containing protein n=1 Tax=Microlunatus capsulatus TaxID=99117 RepID=A0ABS4Z2A1_9ACTN|nr:integrin alpha [Microlunatus capsulatus]MBP2415165.1 hypothetical protein [Microlunatus capsulatus]
MTRSTSRRLRWAGAVVALGLAAPALAPPSPAAAAEPACRLPGERVAVGLPVPEGRRTPGAVDVRSVSPATPSLLVLPPERAGGDPDPQEFGAAVVLSDLDADGCVDLVVGAPGADRVYLVNGRRADQRVADLTWTAEDLLPGATGRERFGAALAVERVNAEPGQPGHGQHRIWIGAPGAVVGGREAAGAVVHLLVDADLRVTSPAVLSQDSPGVPGGAEAGDRFGEVLEPVGDVALPSTDEQLPPAGFPSGVAVGVPHEDLGRAVDAGMVVLLPAPGGPALPTPRSLTQDTPGVPGAVEGGDRFGAALELDATPREPVPVLWVGSPGEDLGRSADAGVVDRFALTRTTVRPTLHLSQDSPGIRGAAEAGDQFGSALASVISSGCTIPTGRFGRAVLAVGSPTEDVAGRQDAGMLTLYSGPVEGCGPLLGGAAGDRAGATAVHGARGRSGVDDEYADVLAWGAPGEDVGTVRDAGVVQVTRPAEPVLVVSAGTASAGGRAGQRYGAALGGYALNGP